MESILNRQFDEKLIELIDHFKNYPELLPFVGNNWNDSKKILLIGESHYFPFDEVKEYSSIEYFNNWYKENSNGINEEHKNWIKTRKNIFDLEQNIFGKAISMYFNIKKAILTLPEFKDSSVVFDKFSYLNYFQKPAVYKGRKNENRSIIVTDFDKKFAFQTLLQVSEVLKPTTIIFVSKKSFDSFKVEKSNHDSMLLKDIIIDFAPHAGRPWWNKKSRVYGNRTGREKFIDLIKECYSK
ncbi:hypothetical protein [Aquiflexum gelatinilyticum]|uniref:hypothetical protein n=1 Tax=Aquiflexum gelatinilyticum TaxID=2961943 RepID=UPI00216A2F7A|nr:hypothetical protein [Aquiflexum gelatinilyticum]MCS4435214.1 hypothetical protein [Aquiflexum gelatinilyticum]